MSKESKLPKYLRELIKKYPKISSGRKNHLNHHTRIMKTISLVKVYIKKN